MKKNVVKKVLCVMMSATVIGCSALSPEVCAWDRERAKEIGKKVAPYVLGVGVPAIAAAIMIPIAINANKKNLAQVVSTGSDTKSGSSADIKITKGIIDKCISEGRLPGIKIYCEKRDDSIVEYGYVLEDEKLASRFLSVYCRLKPIDIKNIFRKDHVNVFFKYSDDKKENFIAEYNLFWSYMKETIGILGELDVQPVGAASGSNSLVSGLRLSNGKSIGNNEEASSDVARTLKIPNEDILAKIDAVESLIKPGAKHSALYDDLRKYGNGDLVGNDEGFKQNIEAVVHEGVIPGLAVLCFNSAVDIWWKKVQMSTWYSYRIIDESVFKGYLRVRLNCDVQQAHQALNLFKEQEQKLFLYDESRIMSVGNWFKQKGLSGLHYLIQYARSRLGYGKSDVIAQPEKSVFAKKEFLEAGLFENFNKDFAEVRKMSDADSMKFNGTVNFSEFKTQPVISEKIRKYGEFLRNCGCL